MRSRGIWLTLAALAGVVVGTAGAAGAAADDTGRAADAGAHAGARAKTVREWAVALATPTLAGAGADAAGKRIVLGHLELELASGRLYPLVAGGRTVGTFFTGRGRFRYASTDPIEAATWKRNVDGGSAYEVDDAGAVADEITDALIVAPGDPQVTGGDGGARESAGVTPGAATTALARHLDRWRHDQALRYSIHGAHALVDPPATPFSLAEIGARRHDVLHVVDPLLESDETFGVMRESTSDIPYLRDLRFSRLLGAQPLGRARLEPRRVPFVIKALDVELVNRSERAAEIRVTETIAVREPLRVLHFRLADWLSGTTGFTGKPTRLSYRLHRVVDGAGRELAYHHDSAELLVELAEPADAASRITLQFDLAGEVLFRPRGDNYWQLDWTWYPTGVWQASEGFTYHAVVKTKKPFTAFSNGFTVRRWEEEDLACAEFSEDLPTQYAVVLAGHYTTYTEARGRLTVRVSSYALPKEAAKKRIAALALDLVAAYEPLLGEYPWRELNVLEINDYGFGVAPAGLLFITKEAFVPLGDERARSLAKGANGRIAHEIAHAWWGHVAKLSEPEEQWLSESTAEYSAALAMDLLGKKKLGQTRAAWHAEGKATKGRWSVYLANYLAGDDAWRDRHRLLYDRGPLLLHALRRELGDETFFALLRRFLADFAMAPVHTRDFIALTSALAGKDYQPWFDRYLLGSEWPPAVD